MTTSDYLEQLQQDREDFIDNLEAKGITGLSGDETFTELVPEVLNIPSGSSSQFTGNFDATGLSAIGYTNSEISDLQKYAIFWDSDYDNDFKLTASELAGDESSTTRYIPKPTTLTSFRNYYRLIAVPTLSFSSSDTDLSYKFGNCYNLRYLKNILIGNQVSTLANMFNGCYTLRRVSFHENIVQLTQTTTMASMFSNCRDLIEINFGGLSAPNTTLLANVSNMFSNCSSLLKVDMSSFVVRNITTISSMFTNCCMIKEIIMPSIELSSNASNVNITSMFNNCYSLNKLDIRGLDFSKIAANTTNAFLNVPNNCLIIVKDATAKTWFATNWPNLLNVKTPSEL